MKRKPFFLLFTCIVLSILVFKTASAQEENKNEFAQRTLDQINDYYKRGVHDSLFDLSNELLVYSQKHQFPYFKGEACKRIGVYYNYYIGNLDSSCKYYEIASEAYSRVKDSTNQAIMNSLLAIILNNSGRGDEAFSTYLKSIDLLKFQDNCTWNGLNHNHIGLIYSQKGNYYLALKYIKNSINFFEKCEDYRNVGTSYNSLGIIYRKTKDKENEENAYLQAIKALEKVEGKQTLGLVYNNLSEVYFDKGEIDLAMETLEKAKDIYESINYQRGMCGYYSVLADYYTDIKPPDFYKVIEYCNKSLPIAKEYGDLRLYADVTSYLGTAYIETGKTTKALSVLHDGLIVAQENDFKPEIVRITDILSKGYKAVNDPKNALKYLELSTQLNDSILNEDKMKEFTQLDMTFKFRQEQIRDSVSQLQNNLEVQLQHEKEIQTQKRSQLILVFTVLIITLIAVFILLYARRNKKQSAILDQKNRIINQALDEKVLLLEEVHHRVKNNFQLVSSLLELQSKEIDDKKALKTISEGQNRVRAMALIHQKLYENDDIKNINFKDYCTQLVNELKDIYGNNKNITTTFEIAETFFDIDTAIPLGLMLNELVTNAFKYAFNKSDNSQLTISLSNVSKGNYLLDVKDNGPGIPKSVDILKMKSLGLRLTSRLTKQLHGKFSYTCEDGCIFSIQFKDTMLRKELD